MPTDSVRPIFTPTRTLTDVLVPARGDNKLAKTRLRGGQARNKTRHLSVFITGLLLGIALPAFIDAIYLSKHTQRTLIFCLDEYS